MSLLNRVQTDGIPFDARVSGPDRMIELVEEVLTNAPVEGIRMFDRVPPRALFAVRDDGRAAHQLWADSIRLVVANAQTSTERQFKDRVGRQVADLLARQSDRRVGTWRVVAARVTTAHRVKWTRSPTGLTRRDVEIPDEKQREDEVRQLTRAVQAKDPVLVVELALAEVTGAKPIDQAFRMEGRQASAYYHWISDGAKEVLTPPRERRAREEAKVIIAAMHGVEPASLEPEAPDLAGESLERASKLLGMGLSPAEVAGALGARVESVAALVQAKAKKA